MLSFMRMPLPGAPAAGDGRAHATAGWVWLGALPRPARSVSCWPIAAIAIYAILHAAIDETFLCARRAIGNKETFDSSPMTCTALKD